MPPRRVLAAAACLVALSGCAAPSRLPAAPTPVLGFGGTAPYVSLAPAAPRAATPGARGVPSRIYVAAGHAIHVIDPRTYRAVGRIHVGPRPRFVIPSWDLKTLWVGVGRGLVPIDPRTGRRARALPVAARDLLFTPNGRDAILIARRRVDLRDPHTMSPRRSIPLPCAPRGSDFTADGSALVAVCAAHAIRVDLRRARVTEIRRLSPRARPHDVKLAPDGTFAISDAAHGGVWTLDAHLRPTGFIPTGPGAHDLIPGHDGLFVTSRTEGSVSLIDFAAHHVIRRWRLPAGSSPTRGDISADGGVLWLSGPSAVYAVSTTTGRILHTVPTARAPRDVRVFPPPTR